MNFELKIALMQKFGRQVIAARRPQINESRLSYLINGDSVPSDTEKAKLQKALGRDYFSANEEGPRAA